MSFKPGDRVRCKPGHAKGMLKEGLIYTIVSSADGLTRLKEVSDRFYTDRFELAGPDPKITLALECLRILEAETHDPKVWAKVKEAIKQMEGN